MMTTAIRQTRRLGAVLLGIMLAGFLALGAALPAAASAVEGDATTYTVRLYGGNRGTVNGQEMVSWDNVQYGSTVDLLATPITVTDGKYYAKGIRPAGLDNVKDVTYVSGPITVTEDADYVVAYGVLADRVEYTVRYVDVAGNELADSKTFTGDIGDMPVAVAIYVEGYVPNAYQATRALRDNASENVITFTYAKLAPGYTTTQNENGTINVVTPQGQTVALNPAPATTAPASAAAGTGQDTVESDETVTAPDGTEILTEDGTPLTMPIESLSIEDDETPLASSEALNGADKADDAFAGWVSIALIAVGVVLLVVAIVLWRRRKHAREDEGY